MRLLAYLNDKWEKDIEKKMKELKGAAGESGTSTAKSSSSGSKSSGGIAGALSGAIGLAKSFLPEAGVALTLLKIPLVRDAVVKFAGPALAAAASVAGFPALAPLALKYGPNRGRRGGPRLPAGPQAGRAPRPPPCSRPRKRARRRRPGPRPPPPRRRRATRATRGSPPTARRSSS